jgi:signal transduction histidine kinase
MFAIFGSLTAILGGLGFAAIFYFAASYEHMTGWKWGLASLALTVTVRTLFPLSFIFVLPAQFGLFCVLWWMNSKRMANLEVERGSRLEQDRRVRQERARIARQEAEADVAARAPDRAAREAKDEAELKARQERVRLVREAREREEREGRKPQE